MRGRAALVLAWVVVALLWALMALPTLASAAPAPRPPGWPSDLCLARGANASNPMCGTCSTTSVYATPELGVAVQWLCKDEDTGAWLVHGFTRTYGSMWMPMPAADLASRGMFAVWWDANTIAAEAPPTEATQRLLAANAYGLTLVILPPDLPPPPVVQWIVAPVSTGLRPSYLLSPAGTLVRETGKFIPTTTAGKSTPCECAASLYPLCQIPGYLTAAGQQRYAACAKAP